MEDKQCKIHVTNLKKNFGKLEVLKDISVDVQEGEVVVLLGPSGRISWRQQPPAKLSLMDMM